MNRGVIYSSTLKLLLDEIMTLDCIAFSTVACETSVIGNIVLLVAEACSIDDTSTYLFQCMFQNSYSCLNAVHL